MIASPMAQWALSALFALVVAYSVSRIARSVSTRERVSYGIHALMGGTMFVMVWPWGMTLPPILQIVVFSLAALWFVFLLIFPAPPSGDAHHEGPRRLAYHGGMMAAMAVMAIGMSATGMDVVGTETATTMPSMAGMSAPTPLSVTTIAPAWASVVGLVFAIAFGIAALYFLVATIAAVSSTAVTTRPGRFRAVDSAWNLLMAVGMSALFLPLISAT
jgi:hypothetical protein